MNLLVELELRLAPCREGVKVRGRGLSPSEVSSSLASDSSSWASSLARLAVTVC